MARKKKVKDLVTGVETEVDDEASETQSFWIVAKQPGGRWRCGRHFTVEPTSVDLTEEEFNLIRNDPFLAISAPPTGTDPKPAAEA